MLRYNADVPLSALTRVFIEKVNLRQAASQAIMMSLSTVNPAPDSAVEEESQYDDDKVECAELGGLCQQHRGLIVQAIEQSFADDV